MENDLCLFCITVLKPCIFVSCIYHHFHHALKSQIRFIPICFPSLSLMVRRCGVMLWCETQLCLVVMWSYTVLCPAFQWLLSKHTQRWKPFLLTHTLWMMLCSAGEQQRLKGPDPAVGLFVYRVLKYDMKYKTHEVRPIYWQCADHFTWHVNWNFLKDSELACKLLTTRQSKNYIRICRRVGVLS